MQIPREVTFELLFSFIFIPTAVNNIKVQHPGEPKDHISMA